MFVYGEELRVAAVWMLVAANQSPVRCSDFAEVCFVFLVLFYLQAHVHNPQKMFTCF